MKTLEEARAYAKQERSVETQEIWEAILAIHKALVLMGSAGLPERIVSIAGANLVRSGAVESGDFTDEQLSSMATADGVRVWEANMGMIFKDEPVIGPDQELYICQQQHQAQAGWAPGHYPHLVPSEYKLYEDGGEIPEPEPSSAPDWNDLEANHPFAVGDHFTYNGTEYEVLRVFSKLDHWAPPALLNDYYKAV